LSAELLSELQSILPSISDNLKNCPPNDFVPKTLPVLIDGFIKSEAPGVPEKLNSKLGQVVWYKKDDTFE